MPHYRLTLEYDGAAFEGWQVQRGPHRTVQGVLEAAVTKVTGESVRVHGAGRTDSGVHAEAQVASVTLEVEREAEALRRALAGVLSDDVVVRSCEVVSEEFHPRFDAVQKLYRYRIWNGVERSPLRRTRWHWLRAPLDLSAMQRAAQALEGEHDFAAFQAAGAEVSTTVRKLYRLSVGGAAGAEIVIDAEGSGFLRHMVRILAGTLIEVGQGRRAPDTMPSLLASLDRSRAGKTAPAHGLTLVRVDYAPDSPGSRNGKKSR